MYSIQALLESESVDFIVSKQEKKYILQYVLAFTSAQLITRDQYILTSQEQDAFIAICQARKNGVPLAYLQHYKEFYGRDFKVGPDVLIPRADTECLIDVALHTLADIHARRHDQILHILDMGTGSGAIAVTLAKQYQGNIHVSACDISKAALVIAQENASRHQAQVDFYESNWWQYWDKNDNGYRLWDVIVSNPPYIAKNDAHLLGEIRFEPRRALTDEADGLQHLQHLIRYAPRYLHPQHGCLIVEHGYDQADSVQAMFADAQFNHIHTHVDLSGQPRVSYGWVKNTL